MVKTSFRIPEDTSQALAQLAERCHNGNRTAALVEAIQRYQAAVFAEPSEPQVMGWVSVRASGKVRCSRCNNPIEGPAFVQLTSGGLEGKFHCGKCAK